MKDITNKQLSEMLNLAYKEGWMDSHHNCVTGDGVSEADNESWELSDTFDALRVFIQN